MHDSRLNVSIEIAKKKKKKKNEGIDNDDNDNLNVSNERNFLVSILGQILTSQCSMELVGREETK